MNQMAENESLNGHPERGSFSQGRCLVLGVGKVGEKVFSQSQLGNFDRHKENHQRRHAVLEHRAQTVSFFCSHDYRLVSNFSEFSFDFYQKLIN